MAGEPILIIEDNASNLKLLKVLFTVEGYEVSTATNAEETWKVLKSFQPSLILMDIQLPGVDGLELTKKLKTDPKYQHIIIIAITAYAMKNDREKAIAAGCDDYIPKPIDVNTLPNIVASYLRVATKA